MIWARRRSGSFLPHLMIVVYAVLCRMGLVLEWVYGTIVSTAEKARDGAKRQLGLRPPTAQAAFDALLRCLEEQATWEQRARASKELLNQVRLGGWRVGGVWRCGAVGLGPWGWPWRWWGWQISTRRLVFTTQCGQLGTLATADCCAHIEERADHLRIAQPGKGFADSAAAQIRLQRRIHRPLQSFPGVPHFIFTNGSVLHHVFHSHRCSPAARRPTSSASSTTSPHGHPQLQHPRPATAAAAAMARRLTAAVLRAALHLSHCLT